MDKSVSAILNLYFDEIDINCIPVQRGIYRGLGLDKGIENYFNLKKFVLPPKEFILTRIRNEDVKKDTEELYRQTNECYLGFQDLIATKRLKILRVQEYCKNEQLKLRGYLDAVIEYDSKKYVVDWKSKETFKTYDVDLVSLTESYNQYIGWCKNNNVNAILFKDFKIRKEGQNQKYALGHFRYCLQVTFYWMLLGMPNNIDVLIAYFSADRKRYLYTFNRKIALKICNDLLRYADASTQQHLIINQKIKNFNWKKQLHWREID